MANKGGRLLARLLYQSAVHERVSQESSSTAKQSRERLMADSTFVPNNPNVSNLNEFGSATNTLSLNLQVLQPDDNVPARTKISDAVDLRAWSMDPDSTTSTMTVDQQGNETIINGSLAGSARAGITVDISTYSPASHALVHLHAADLSDFDIIEAVLIDWKPR
jgi:hypothetical protein